MTHRHSGLSTLIFIFSWVALLPAQPLSAVRSNDYRLGTPPTAPTSLQASIRALPGTAGKVQAATNNAAKDIRFHSNVPSLRVSTVGPDTLVVGRPATYCHDSNQDSNQKARKARPLVRATCVVSIRTRIDIQNSSH